MGRKFTIDLDDRTFEELKASYMEAKKMSNNAEFTFEEFIYELLKSYTETKKQMDVMGDQFKNMINSFGNGSLEDLFNSMMKQSNTPNDPFTEPSKKPVDKKEAKDADETNESEPKAPKSYKS